MGASHRKRPPAEWVLNLKKLLEARERAGLSGAEAERLAGLPASTIYGYENGAHLPQLHGFRALCLAYRLDPLEIIELLRIDYFLEQYRLLQRFRAACKREGTAPGKALEDFMRVYAEDDR